jgi:dynein heavy chain
MDYEFEYVGCSQRLVLTAGVKSSWLNCLLAVRGCSSLCLAGESGTAKLQTIRELSHHHGKFCLPVACNSFYSYKTLHQVFLGISQTGVKFA